MTVVSLHDPTGEATIKILPADSASNFSIYNNLSANKIVLPTSDGLIFENVFDIISLEAQGSYTLFHFINDKSFIASKPINCFEELLNQKQFFRTHRSVAINVLRIKKYVKGKYGHVLMENDMKFAVSVSNKTEFTEKLKSIFTFYSV